MAHWNERVVSKAKQVSAAHPLPLDPPSRCTPSRCTPLGSMHAAGLAGEGGGKGRVHLRDGVHLDGWGGRRWMDREGPTVLLPHVKQQGLERERKREDSLLSFPSHAMRERQRERV